MDMRGNIEVKTENREFVDDEFLATHPGMAAGKYLKLSVRDTGKGIPEELRTKVFDPFFTTKEENGGSGLGLSVVASVVQNHKGCIDLESKVGAGTQFDICLPFYANGNISPKNQEQEARPKINGRGSTILFVEDEEDIRKFFADFFIHHEYDVLTAATGAEGVQKYKSYATAAGGMKGIIDLVMLDWTLPDTNGGVVYRKIKQMNPNQRIFMCTASPEDEIYNFLGEKPVVIKKPFVPGDLLEIITAAIKK
jgi:CheY-like chemotaxis protein